MRAWRAENKIKHRYDFETQHTPWPWRKKHGVEGGGPRGRQSRALGYLQMSRFGDPNSISDVYARSVSDLSESAARVWLSLSCLSPRHTRLRQARRRPRARLVVSLVQPSHTRCPSRTTFSLFHTRARRFPEQTTGTLHPCTSQDFPARSGCIGR